MARFRQYIVVTSFVARTEPALAADEFAEIARSVVAHVESVILTGAP